MLPLLTGFRVPSPRDECEFEREVLPDLLPPVPRDRRDEFELAEDGREGWEGGARVAPDVVEVGGAEGLGVWSGEAMIAGRPRCGRKQNTLQRVYMYLDSQYGTPYCMQGQVGDPNEAKEVEHSSTYLTTGESCRFRVLPRNRDEE